VKQIRNPNIEIRTKRGSRVGCRGVNPSSLDTRHSTLFLLFSHLKLFRISDPSTSLRTGFVLRIFWFLGDLTTLSFSLGGDGDLRRAGPFDNRHYFYRVAEQHVFVAAENDSLIRTSV
jgi:hypothetical protein